MSEIEKKQLCDCRFCGSGADVFPKTEQEWEDAHRCAVRITCTGCCNVDVWAMNKKDKFSYKELVKTATERWNSLMGKKEKVNG